MCKIKQIKPLVKKNVDFSNENVKVIKKKKEVGNNMGFKYKKKRLTYSRNVINIKPLVPKNTDFKKVNESVVRKITKKKII